MKTISLLALVAALLTPGVAAASSKVVQDPNDSRSALDIRSIAHGHADGAVVHTITTFAAFRAGAPAGDNGFNLEFSTDQDRAPERFALVYFRRGKLRAVIANVAGKTLGNAAVSRPNARSVRLVIPKALLGNPRGYRWSALSYYRGGACGEYCFDVAPRLGEIGPRVSHDLTAPAISLLSFPNPTTNASALTTFDVRFHVSDRGCFTACRTSWRLERRLLGTTTWALARSGSSPPDVLSLSAAEGANLEFRVVARDKDGNTTTSPTRQVSVPLDDQNAAFASAFSGAWGTPTVGGDFQGAVHWVSLSEDPTATFTYSFNGTYVGWIAHPGLENPSTANVVIDGGLPQSVDLWASAGPRKLVFERTLSAGAHTITISVVAGRITVDGLVVR